MGSTGKARGLVTLLALLGVAGAAGAQNAPGAANPQRPAVELGAGQDVALSPEMMAANAKSFLPEMDRGAAVVRRLLADARERRDVVRVLCLNDKLNQIDLASRTASDRVESLNAAAQQKDADRTKHEYTVAAVLRDRVRTLVNEANQCIGEQTGFFGESAVTVDIDPNIPDTDPSDYPDDPLVSTPPVLSSPTL
ncbi:MAG TPA: hypothetical protein VG937_02920 [Polyangiaceae bacterium]|nr:hypothetical protein [Polyangiaceae bacterium]